MKSVADGPLGKILYVGQSHLGAVSRGLNALRARNEPVHEGWFVWVNDDLAPWLSREKPGALGDKLQEALRLATQRYPKPDLVALSIAGNHHNVLGLLEHERPFDFVLSEMPGLPLREAGEVVPEKIVENALARSIRPALDLLYGIVRSLKETYVVGLPRIVHLESPPPNPSAPHILEHLEKFYSERDGNRSVAPVELRFKLWRAHSAMFRTACQLAGVTYVEVPPQCKDAEGYLAARAWGDSTHGNEWYGEQQVLGLEQLIRGLARRAPQ